MNSVTLIGRLARDPELNNQGQVAICRITLAVDRPPRKDGERQADFIRITVFGKQAETCSRYLSKGRQIAVQGRIQTGSYNNKDGQTVYTTDVIADRVEFLGSKGDNSPSNAPKVNEVVSSQPQQGTMSQEAWDLPDSFSASEDDIPF